MIKKTNRREDKLTNEEIITQKTFEKKEIKINEKVILQKTEELVVEKSVELEDVGKEYGLKDIDQIIQDVYQEIVEEEEVIQENFQVKEDELKSLVSYLKKEQEKQEHYVKELQHKLSKAIHKYEKQETKIKFMSEKTKKALILIALPMAVKPIRKISATVFLAALTTATLKEMLKIEREVVTRKVVEVKDFSREIVNAIFDIKDIKNSISIGREDIDKIKEELETEYEHLKETDSYSDLLKSLDKLKEEFKIKEEELDLILDDQDKNLDRNNHQLKLIKK